MFPAPLVAEHSARPWSLWCGHGRFLPMDRQHKVIELLTEIRDLLAKGSTTTTVTTGDVKSVVDHYQAFHPRSKDRQEKNIRARLKEGYSIDDLKNAISGCHLSPFHCGVNDQQVKYQSLELIVRSATSVDRFMELYGQFKKKPTSKAMDFEQFRSGIIRSAKAQNVDVPNDDTITAAYTQYVAKFSGDTEWQ